MKSEQPLVSIIVITYNSAKYVIETLESAKAQTYQNIELIVTDDFSKDNTVAICKEWLEKNNSRFKRTDLITVAQNTGIPGNCNRGLNAAKGEWVKIIAGDDLLLENCISENYNYTLENPEAQIVTSDMQPFLDGSVPKKLLEVHKVYGNVFSEKNSAVDQYNFLLKKGYFGTSPSLFISRHIFDTIKYDESLPLMEDYPFALNATRQGYKFYYLEKVTVLYRIRESSTFNKRNEELFGNFYKAKHIFDAKYRFPYLDAITYRKEKYYYNIKKNLDQYNLNKNTFVNRWLYKIANFSNPWRYIGLLRTSNNGKRINP